MRTEWLRKDIFKIAQTVKGFLVLFLFHGSVIFLHLFLRKPYPYSWVTPTSSSVESGVQNPKHGWKRLTVTVVRT